MINSGVGGNTTEHGKLRFEEDVLSHNPDIVIIQFGINDSMVNVFEGATESRVDRLKYKENLEYFIQELKKENIYIILMTPNPIRWTDETRELYGGSPYDLGDENGLNNTLKYYAETVRGLSRKYNTALVDVYCKFQHSEQIDALLLDGMHPNDKGHELVANQLMFIIRNKL